MKTPPDKRALPSAPHVHALAIKNFFRLGPLDTKFDVQTTLLIHLVALIRAMPPHPRLFSFLKSITIFITYIDRQDTVKKV